MSRYILGVTGASGAIYASRTAMYLKRLGHEVSLVVTAPGREVVEYEGQTSLFEFGLVHLAGEVGGAHEDAALAGLPQQVVSLKEGDGEPLLVALHMGGHIIQ